MLFSMMFTVLIIIRFLSLTTQVQSCPSDLVDVGDNQCMAVVKGSYNYCEAHQACSNHGRDRGVRLFMVGLHREKISRNFKQHKDFGFFTGLHSLLFDATSGQNQWQVSDPGEGQTAIKQHAPAWAVYDGKNSSGLVVTIGAHRFRAVNTGHIRASVVCELTGLEYANKLRIEQFHQTWPHQIKFPFLTDGFTDGCWAITNRSTLLSCALRCHQHEHCRSLYYNQLTRECYLALYVDSRLPHALNNQLDEWIRYGRVGW